jgi:hypothetical protein
LICFSVDKCKKTKKNKISNYTFKKSKQNTEDQENLDQSEFSDRVNSRLELFELRLYDSILDKKLKQAQYNGYV